MLQDLQPLPPITKAPEGSLHQNDFGLASSSKPAINVPGQVDSIQLRRDSGNISLLTETLHNNPMSSASKENLRHAGSDSTNGYDRDPMAGSEIPEVGKGSSALRCCCCCDFLSKAVEPSADEAETVDPSENSSTGDKVSVDVAVSRTEPEEPLQ